MNKSYVIFDGQCGFCNKTIMFIANNDKHNNYIFVPSNSKFGAKLLFKHNIKGLEKATIILLENKIYTKSIAIRRIMLKLPYYKILGFFMFLFPIKLSNFVYDFISKNRKRVVKNSICKMPNSEIRKEFIT